LIFSKIKLFCSLKLYQSNLTSRTGGKRYWGY